MRFAAEGVPSKTRKMELRFSAKQLINKDTFSLSDPFLVCHTVRDGEAHREIGRTETVQDDLNPNWQTTFTFDYDSLAHANAAFMVDIFDRDSRDSLKLSKHDFLGRAFFHIADLVGAPHMRLDLELQPAVSRLALYPHHRLSSTSSSLTSHDTDEDVLPRNVRLSSASSLAKPSITQTPLREQSIASAQLRRATSGTRASKVRGSVSIFAEWIAPTTGISVVFRVRSALLRDACGLGSAFGVRKMAQFYEIQRARTQTDGRSTWSCVHRSADGVTVDRNNYVTFDDVGIPERTLNNMQDERDLRIAFYRRHTRSAHQLISYIGITLDEVGASRFRNNDVAVPMEGEFGDDDGLGNVLVRRVERWVSEPNVERLTEDSSVGGRDDMLIQLRADHFLNRKFVSSLNDNPRHMRRLRKMPAFITLH